MAKNCKIWLGIGLAGLALMPGLAQAAGVNPVGNWLRDNGTVRMAISRCGDNFCAVNTWVKSKGPEKVGDELILTMQPVSGTEFQGKAYDVRRHETYKMTVTLQGNHMETTGCVLLGIVCKGTGWRRID